jgi:hypothetical protein
MIKLISHDPVTNEPYLTLVLEPSNLKRLRQDNPIIVQVDEVLSLPQKKLRVMIAYHPDPRKFAEKLQKEFKVERVIDTRVEFEDHAEAKGQDKDFRKPRCPSCDFEFSSLGMFTVEDHKTAFFFCPNCGAAFGAQYLGPLPLPSKRKDKK